MPAREAYEKPQIIRHERNIGNHFGQGPARKLVEDIDGVPVARLVEEHGSPLFVFSERSLRDKADEARRAFARHPGTRFAWSYKTNHLDAICGLFHQEGWSAEVVSAAEYEMARRLGVPGEAIVFNGACKPAPSLRRAIDEGALIQIDHFDELALLVEIAGQRAGGPRARVGLRVNMTVEAIGLSWDRFGFQLESGDALRAARRVVESEGLDLVGMHCHLGTYIPQPAAYRESARRLADFARDVERETGARIAVLNLGGGFPSRSALYTSYGDDTAPPLADFAEAILDELEEAYAKEGRPLPELVLESGRALVDDAGTLLTTVMGTRRMPNARRGVILDAGVNLLYTATWYRHEVYPTETVRGHLEETTLYGPLCMAIDVVRRGLLLPPLEPGHVVAVRPVGAYNVTQWMQFSQMRPAIVMITTDGNVEVIRRAETIMDLKNVEQLPERFRPDPAALDGRRVGPRRE